MLFNSDDDKNKKQDRLIHADSDNENLTDDVKQNENSLFGKPNVSTDKGHDSLFNSSYDNEMDDDFISSSFAVSFKANDAVNTVSDKLKEEQEHPQVSAGDPLSFEDDLEGFEFDSNISAFKPLNAAPSPAPEHVAKKESVIVPPVVEPVKPAAEDKPDIKDPFEGIDDITPPKFTDDDKDFLDMAGMSDSKDDKLFKSGEDLDFATSSKDQKKSPFAHSEKPAEAPASKDIDIPSSNNQKEADTAPIKTYGTVSSGVNAFKKTEPVKETPKETNKTQEINPEPVKEHPNYAPTEVLKDQSPAPASTAGETEVLKPQPMAQAQAPVQEQKNQKAAAAAAPVLVPVPTAGETEVLKQPEQNPFQPKNQAVRPASTEPVKRVRPGAVEKKAPAAPAPEKTSASIEPVSQVNTKKKRKEPKSKKDPGKGGLITLAVVIAVFLGVFLLLDNLDKITNAFKGDNPIQTIETSSKETTEEATTETSAVTESSQTKETTEATTAATTTEATTTTAEATTEATTTTTTEATTTTTTEATTTTTEATTAATTAATTSSSGARVVNMGTQIRHFKREDGGFRFDVIFTNNTSTDASLSASLSNLKITLYSSSSITNVTSDGFTFSHSGKTYTCSPIDQIIPAGGSVTIRIHVSTSSRPGHYGYNSAVFNWT